MFGLSVHNAQIAEAHVSCALLAGAAVVVRLFCKFTYQKGIKADDWFIIVALVFYYGAVATVLRESITNFGPLSKQYLNDIGDEEFFDRLSAYRRSMFAAFILATTAQYGCKMSVLFFYRSIFFVCPTHRKVTLGVMIFVTAWFIAVELATFCMCRPIDKFWHPHKPATCGKWWPMIITMLIVDAVIDFSILVLPVRTALGLQLPRRTKFAVAGIFALGGFVVLTNVLRLIFGQEHGDPSDVFYNQAELWTSVHLFTAILCASLPICRPLCTSMSSAASRLSSRCAESILSLLDSNKARPETTLDYSRDGADSNLVTALPRYSKQDDPSRSLGKSLSSITITKEVHVNREFYKR